MRENRQFNNHENHGNSNLSDLARKEQEHRHGWQDKHLRNSIFTFRMGQFFGFIYNLALLALVYILIQQGEKELALKLFFGNLAIIAFALLITTIERKSSARKPQRKGGRNDRRYRGRDRNRDDRRDNHREERRDDRR